MRNMEILWYFLAGFALINAIPHLVKGITGETHMTPFKRVSSPMLNIVWSYVNIFMGLFFLGLGSGEGMFVWPWDASITGSNFWAFIVGGIFTAITAAWLFGRPNARLPWHTD